MLAPLLPVTVKDVNVAAAGVGIFKTFETKVAAPLPVVVKDVIRFVYAVSKVVLDVVVGIAYPVVVENTPVVFV